MEKDLDSGEMYLLAEKNQKQMLDDRKANTPVLKRLIASYQATGFLDLIRECGGVEEQDDRYIFSINQVGRALGRVPLEEQAPLQEVWSEIRTIAKQKRLAWLRRGGHHIEFAKPMEELDTA